MSALTNLVSKIGDPLKSGSSLITQFGGARMGALIEAIQALARGDNIKAGKGIRLLRLPGQVIISSDRDPSSVDSVAAPLTLTMSPSPGWSRPEPDQFVGFRVWVTPGLLDYSLPSNIDLPIEFPTTSQLNPVPNSPTSTVRMSVWLKAQWEGEFIRPGVPMWTSLSIEHTEQPSALAYSNFYPQPPPINTETNPGLAGAGFYDHYIIPIGYISRSAVLAKANDPSSVYYVDYLTNAGSGSFATIASSYASGSFLGSVDTDPPRVDIYYNFTFRRYT